MYVAPWKKYHVSRGRSEESMKLGAIQDIHISDIHISDIHILENFINFNKAEESDNLIGSLLTATKMTPEIEELFNLTLQRNKIMHDITLDLYDGLVESSSEHAIVALRNGLIYDSQIEEINLTEIDVNPREFQKCVMIDCSNENLTELGLLTKYTGLFRIPFNKFIIKTAIRSELEQKTKFFGYISLSEEREVERIISLESIEEVCFNINLAKLYSRDRSLKERKTAILNPMYKVSDYFKRNTNTVIVRTKQ